MQGVRWREDTGFEGKCDLCRSYWPLDEEFWRLKHGLRTCRACLLNQSRALDLLRQPRRSSPEALAERRLRDKLRQARTRRDPARRPRVLERQRLTQRRYYENRRDEVLERRRAAYEVLVGHPPRPGVGRPRAAA